MDLQRVYHIDLVDALHSGSRTPKELLALIRWLPQGSVRDAVQMGDETMFGYTRPVAVSADVYDAVMTNMVGTAMGKMKRLPDPYPRPGVDRDGSRSLIPAGMSVKDIARKMRGA